MNRLPSSPQTPRRPRGFSLVELLVVITIIGLLTGLAVPAFQSLGAAGKLASGTTEVATVLAIARSQAIATRKLTRFVVATDWPGDASANYRKFSIWQFQPDETSSGGQWVQYTRWENLPDGVAFDPNSAKAYRSSASSLNNNPQATQGPDLFLNTAANACIAGGQLVKGRYIEFSPRGSVRSALASDSVTWFTIAEGAIDGQGMRYTHGGSAPANWRQIGTGTLLGRATIYTP